MGTWRQDQSKGVRRKVWGQTRGQEDDTRKDFVNRLKAYPVFASLRVEKIGSEIHFWRQLQDEKGELYWASCLRFIDDGWSHWTVMYRTDERRWRTTPIKDLPTGRALTDTAA